MANKTREYSSRLRFARDETRDMVGALWETKPSVVFRPLAAVAAATYPFWVATNYVFSLGELQETERGLEGVPIWGRFREAGRG